MAVDICCFIIRFFSIYIFIEDEILVRSRDVLCIHFIKESHSELTLEAFLNRLLNSVMMLEQVVLLVVVHDSWEGCYKLWDISIEMSYIQKTIMNMYLLIIMHGTINSFMSSRNHAKIFVQCSLPCHPCKTINDYIIYES